MMLAETAVSGYFLIFMMFRSVSVIGSVDRTSIVLLVSIIFGTVLILRLGRGKTYPIPRIGAAGIAKQRIGSSGQLGQN